MLARQLAYITYVRGSMSTLQILLFLYFYGFMPPTLSREEPLLNTYSLRFKSWLDNTISYDLPAEIPGLWLMLYLEDDHWILTAYLMKYFYIDDFENGHFEFDPEIIETNHLRSIPVFSWAAEDDNINTAADHFWTLFDKYRESTNKLDRIGAIILSFGKSTQLVYFRNGNKRMST